MASVSEHYDRHLGPIYSWMIGDVAAAIQRNREELRALGLRPGSTGAAIDLGAGPGLHAIPLAELGFSVLAIDHCASLVQELESRSGALPIRTVEGDLRDFSRHLQGPADAILCMGDTLTHLPSRESVQALLHDVSAALAAGGTFIASFRDYASTALEGEQRFIPVRSDAVRSLICFLEYGEQTITTYDLLQERTETGTELRVSSYPKLRLPPSWVADILTARGFHLQQDIMPSGMVRIIARRP